MNAALIEDSNYLRHEIPCDFIEYSSGWICLYGDHRSATSNRVELVAAFYKPVSAKLKNPPEPPAHQRK